MNFRELLFHATRESNEDYVKMLLAQALSAPPASSSSSSSFSSPSASPPSLSPLHLCIMTGSSSIFNLLLSHPSTNPNAQDENGITPAMLACIFHKRSFLKALIFHPLSDLSLLCFSPSPSPCPCPCSASSSCSPSLSPHSFSACSPSPFPRFSSSFSSSPSPSPSSGASLLWLAVYYANSEAVTWMIASGKELNWAASLSKEPPKPSNSGKLERFFSGREEFTGLTALELARMRVGMDGWERVRIRDVLEEYLLSPLATVARMRKLLGWKETLVAELYAWVTFFCDAYLTLQPQKGSKKDQEKEEEEEEEGEEGKEAQEKARRFFAMMASLPVEIQMKICHWARGSSGQFVLLKDLRDVSFMVAQDIILFYRK